MTALFAALVCVGQALATPMALDPQNRLHLGLNVVDGPSNLGITGGFDSRMIRLVSVDIGGFMSPIPIAAGEGEGEVREDYPDYLHLRHGLYVAPGLRIPHPQPREWAYELFLRGGGGVVWNANLSPDARALDGARHLVSPGPAGVLGADALVRVGLYGARVSGKAWMFDALRLSPPEDFFVLRTQWSVEALVQW